MSYTCFPRLELYLVGGSSSAHVFEGARPWSYLEPAIKLNWREAPKNEGSAKKRGSKATEDVLCFSIGEHTLRLFVAKVVFL